MLSYAQAIKVFAKSFDYEKTATKADVLAVVYQKSFNTVWDDLKKEGNIKEYTVKLTPLNVLLKELQNHYLK